MWILSHQSTAGWVIRDSNGYYLVAGQAKGNKVHNALESEIQALLIAMQFCRSKGYKKIIFEGDNKKIIDIFFFRKKKIIDILTKERLHFDVHNWIREMIWWSSKFEEVQYHWIGREGSTVADQLAKKQLPKNISYVFHFFVPRCMNSFLHHDYVKTKDLFIESYIINKPDEVDCF